MNDGVDEKMKNAKLSIAAAMRELESATRLLDELRGDEIYFIRKDLSLSHLFSNDNTQNGKDPSCDRNSNIEDNLVEGQGWYLPGDFLSEREIDIDKHVYSKDALLALKDIHINTAMKSTTVEFTKLKNNKKKRSAKRENQNGQPVWATNIEQDKNSKMREEEQVSPCRKKTGQFFVNLVL
jgi:hypothetical protein